MDRAVELINSYGPTETTVVASLFWIEANLEPGAEVSLGRPIPGARLYGVDPGFATLPIAVPGELLIGGSGVARGYLNRPELTAERFVPHPFATEPGARLYRTGDLARFLPDGNLEFLGRADNQVKLRGIRIELEEIEVALAGHPDVRQAAVVLRGERESERRLAAFVVPPEQLGKLPDGLRDWLGSGSPRPWSPRSWWRSRRCR